MIFRGFNLSKLLKYKKNGAFLKETIKELTPHDVPAYISQYGDDRALGYQDCVNDIIERLDFSIRNKTLQSEAQFGPKEDQAVYVIGNHIIDQLKILSAFQRNLKNRSKASVISPQ